MADEPKLEPVAANAGVAVRRMAVPGGWLYVSRTVAPTGANPNTPVSIASTFVPDPHSGGAP